MTFKGISKKTNQWVEGDLLQLYNGDRYIVNNKFGACIDSKGNFINTEEPFVHEVIEETICMSLPSFQLKDGTLLYQNDLLTVVSLGCSYNGVLSYDDKFCMWYVDTGNTVLPVNVVESVVITGNKFDSRRCD